MKLLFGLLLAAAFCVYGAAQSKELRILFQPDPDQFADAQVAVEKQRGRMYPAAWDFALSFTPEQRTAKWKEVLAERTPRSQ